MVFDFYKASFGFGYLNELAFQGAEIQGFIFSDLTFMKSPGATSVSGKRQLHSFHDANVGSVFRENKIKKCNL